jgi:5-methyltetrahydrofolate--homocysteine methyltransferase
VEEVRQAYAEQAAALTAGGVDLLVIETQFSLEEAQAAVEGARSASHLPLVISFSFDKGVRTMMGVKPSQVVDTFTGLGVAAIGANCGKSLEFMEKVVQEMASVQTGIPIWAKPNAGMPVPGTTPAQYDTTPEQMAQATVRLVQAGAQVVGGCCGSAPAHIAAIAAAILSMD